MTADPPPNSVPHDAATAAQLAGDRAAHLFNSKQLWCTAAVMVSLNEGFKGGLPTELAVRLASGFGDGLAGAGCMCGALGGGVQMLGLFLGNGRFGPMGNRLVMNATRQLHDRFKETFGATCCRVLSRNLTSGSREHYDRCARHTGQSARWVAEAILSHRPDLIRQVDWAYLQQKETWIGNRLKRVWNVLKVSP